MVQIASLAFAAALLVTVEALEKCVYSVVAPQLHALGPEITACYEATGYYLAPPPADPTPVQQEGICTKCQAFITKVTPMTWPECTLNLAGRDQTLTAFFTSVTAPCLATTAPTPTTTAPTPTTTTPTVTPNPAC